MLNHHPTRARHTIRLSSIRHNYNIVSSAANKQRCSVITVVKADGYGHGAIETALHLADYCGADAFAVATLEEGVALRKALVETAVNVNVNVNRNVNMNSSMTSTGAGMNLNLNKKIKTKTPSIISPSLFTPPAPPKSIDVQSQSDVSLLTKSIKQQQQIQQINQIQQQIQILQIPRKKIRSNNIRIIVLGPPTNIPHDFHLYNHYNIELMVSSSKMARALMEWVADCDGRRIAEVDHVANERVQELVEFGYGVSGEEVERKGALVMRNAMMNTSINSGTNGGGGGVNNKSITNGGNEGGGIGIQNGIHRHQAATLTSMEGSALGKEVRELLNKKKDAVATAATAATATSSTAAKTAGANANANAGAGEQNENQSVAKSTIGNSNVVYTTYTTPTNSNNNSLVDKNKSRGPSPAPGAQPFAFKGIEDTAKESRRLQLAAERVTAHFTGEGDDSDDDGDENENNARNNNNSISNIDKDNECSSISRASTSSSSLGGSGSGSGNVLNVNIVNDNELDDSGLVKTVSSAVASAAIAAATNNAVPIKARKRVRWHALIDSGMGRLGFKSVEDDDDDDDDGGGCGGNDSDGRTSGDENGNTNSNNSSLFGVPKLGPNGEKRKEKWKDGPHRDTVSIIKDMMHAEIDGAPIEFYGMCTHMAEASSNSTYTNEQMSRFKSLLRRVRQAGISVPTISTDNSSALLTPTLMHFDPVELLSQPAADTRGFVRTGGAVYGQRPAFPQLRAVSTLTASVRHVAVLEKGESVGYDRAYMAERKVRIATLSIGFAGRYLKDVCVVLDCAFFLGYFL